MPNDLFAPKKLSFASHRFSERSMHIQLINSKSALLTLAILAGNSFLGVSHAIAAGESPRQERVPDHRVFSIQDGIRVPDGTLVYPFLNPKDRTSGLPWDLMDGFSIAAGDIEPGNSSKIHLMPVTSQVTFVLEGELEVRMKEPARAAPYSVKLTRHQAVLTKPFVFLQFINRSDRMCRVLYLVSPPYLFSLDDAGNIEYDDSITFDEDWMDLERVHWKPEGLPDRATAAREREQAHQRIGGRDGTSN